MKGSFSDSRAIPKGDEACACMHVCVHACVRMGEMSCVLQKKESRQVGVAFGAWGHVALQSGKEAISGRRAFQAERMASTKVLRLDHT